jgi:YVTN family beta-propeller protein
MSLNFLSTSKLLTAGLLSLFLFSSCEKDKETIVASAPDNLNGVFIINEGAYGSGNGSISFISNDSSYYNSDLYNTINNSALGDIVQSMTIYNNYAYIPVNNSQRMEVVSMNNFKRKGSITGLSSPRFFVGNGSTGFVSDWVSNSVYVINLNSLTITDTIHCGAGPEGMTIVNNKLFICNSGGFGDDSTVTVADATTHEIITTIHTPVNPTSVAVDANGMIRVLCKGSLGSDYTPTPDDAPGALISIDPSNFGITQTLYFNYDQHPVKMQISADKLNLFYLNGNQGYSGTIDKILIDATTLPTTPFINSEFYGLGVNPKNGDIYGGRVNFSANAYVVHYNTNGIIQDSVLAGVGPNGFAFN